MRGRLIRLHTGHGVIRLIPACAGQTGCAAHPRGWCRAHPRVCGADLANMSASETVGGSSPRVRGRRRTQGSCRGSSRLIPACAGQTMSFSHGRCHHGAHPRVCGADLAVRASRFRHLGSSPRVRGRPAGGALGDGGERLIPACAGQTAGPSGRSAPRVGSSPRVRGRLSGARAIRWPSGLIPACAGQTRHRGGEAARARAHPRVCGADPELST